MPSMISADAELPVINSVVGQQLVSQCLVKVNLRACLKIRKRRARARKVGWQGPCEGESPQRALTEQVTLPTAFLALAQYMTPGSVWIDWRVKRVASLFCLACVGRAGQARCEDCRRPPALARQKIPSNAALPNFQTGS